MAKFNISGLKTCRLPFLPSFPMMSRIKNTSFHQLDNTHAEYTTKKGVPSVNDTPSWISNQNTPN